MNLHQVFDGSRPAFTFEIFPPKKTSGIETIYKTLDGLKDLRPDFISVTYGAGGNAADTKTCDIAQIIEEQYQVPSAVHLTCLYNSKEDIDKIVEQLKERNIKNILALRGDVNPDVAPKSDFKYATDLVSYLKSKGDFYIMGGCYPECHPQCASLEEDIMHLKEKVDAGTDRLLSQLFFNNDDFIRYMEKVRAAGIFVPVEAGIMPVVNKAQIERMVTLCGASLPPKFARMMARFEHEPDALRDAGIAYAIDQIVDLLSQGVDGIHLYTMNNPYVARKITEAVEGMFGREKRGN